MHMIYEYINNINDNEYLKYSKIFNLEFKTIKEKEHLLGIILLCRLFKKYYHMDLDRINYRENGKPYIDDYYFSISHSKGLVICIINDNDIGIDIEIIRNKNDLVIKKLFNDRISKLINSDKDYIDWFTRYEALYKLDGSNINNVCLDDYIFKPLVIDNYLGNICIKK